MNDRFDSLRGFANQVKLGKNINTGPAADAIDLENSLRYLWGQSGLPHFPFVAFAAAMVSKPNTDNYSSISPQATTHQQSPLEFSEAPPLSSSAIKVLRAFPPAIKFIFWNECCERFSFYGLKAILALFLSERLGLSQVTSTEMFHLFTMMCYATPILGALISDTLLVNYQI
jgi:hypothetical protein